MDSSTSKNNVKLPVFDGKHESFQNWWRRFNNYARYYRFMDVLKATVNPDLPEREDSDVDPTTPEGKKATLALEKNALAMVNLSIACEADSAMAMIYKGSNEKWPNGRADLVVKALLHKFQPNDVASRMELRQKLNGLKLAKGENPANLFDQIDKIKNQFYHVASDVSDIELIAIITNVVSSEYKLVMTGERRLRGNDLTLEHLADALNEHWRSSGSEIASSESQGSDREFVLASFGGYCFECKQQGHKQHECPNKRTDSYQNTGNQNNQGQTQVGTPRFGFAGTCNNCGKRGHRFADCWDREENRDKRPPSYRPRNNGTPSNNTAPNQTQTSSANQEMANANVNIDSITPIEFCLCNVTASTETSILMHPNVFMADTGSTTHTTRHLQGARNIRIATRADSVTVGNGTSEGAT